MPNLCIGVLKLEYWVHVVVQNVSGAKLLHQRFVQLRVLSNSSEKTIHRL